MSKIVLRNSFKACPEGKHIFRIYKVDYNVEFGKLNVFMVNAQGDTHVEKFSLLNDDNTPNDKAHNAFAILAKAALNDTSIEEIEHTDLVNHYIGGEIVHTVMPNRNDPTKTVTFVNMTTKWAADDFDTTPVDKALTLGTETSSPAPTKSGEVDLNSLLD